MALWITGMLSLFIVGIIFAKDPLIGGRDGNIMKRQAPTSSYYFLSPSYVLTAPSNAPGTLVNGRAQTNYDTGALWSIVYPTNNFAININTGRLVVINYLQACTKYPVTVRANNPSRGTISTNVFIQSAGCSSGSTTASGSPQFTQSSPYSLSTGSCAANTFVGTVAATNGTYTLNSPYFNINPINGQIFLTSPPSTSPTVVSVTAVNSRGSTAVPVTIYTSGCTGATGSSPTFTQTAYTFTASNCAPGGFVGQITALSSGGGAVSYSLSQASPYFTIVQSTGAIIVASPPYAGTIQMFYVTALDSFGRTSTMPVTVVVPNTCPGAAATSPPIGDPVIG